MTPFSTHDARRAAAWKDSWPDVMASLKEVHADMEAAIRQKFDGKKDFKLQFVGDAGQPTTYLHASWSNAKSGKAQKRFFFAKFGGEEACYFQRKTESGVKELAAGDNQMYGYDEFEELLDESPNM